MMDRAIEIQKAENGYKVSVPVKKSKDDYSYESKYYVSTSAEEALAQIADALGKSNVASKLREMMPDEKAQSRYPTMA